MGKTLDATLQIRNGLKANLAAVTDAVTGEAFFAKDTGELFIFDGTAMRQISGGSGSSTLAGDTDVSITSPSNGQVLKYNSTAGKWKNQTDAGAGTLAGDSDVELVSPADGDVLTYVASASKWENKPSSGSGVPFQTLPCVVCTYHEQPDALGNILAFVGGDDATEFGNTVRTGGNLPSSGRGPTQAFGGYSGSAIASGFNGQPLYAAGRHVKLICEFWISPTAGSPSVDFATLVWVGFGPNPTTATSSTPWALSNSFNGAAFRFSTLVGDTTWHAACWQNGTGHVVDTGVSPDTNSHKFAVLWDDANAQVLFYIDGTLVATISGSSVPPVGTNLAVGCSTYQTAADSPDIYFTYAQAQADY